MSGTDDEMTQVALEQALHHLLATDYSLAVLKGEVGSPSGHDSRFEEIHGHLVSARNLVADLRDHDSGSDEDITTWLRRLGPSIATDWDEDHDDPRQ